MPLKLKLAIILILVFVFSATLFNSAQAKTVRLVKTANDAKVFLVDNNRRVHIPNPSVFEAGGYKWADIKIVSQKEMNSISNTALIKSPVDAKVYLIEDGKKAWIPDEKTFLDGGLKWSDIIVISQAQVDFYDEKSYNPADVAKVVEDVKSPTNTKTAVGNAGEVEVNSGSTDKLDNLTQITDDYKRPDKIKIREIGKYTLVVPGFSNQSIESTKLFNNGEIYVVKYEAGGENGQFKNYIWKDGILRPYTETDYLYQMNDKGEKIVSILPSYTPYFLDGNVKERIQTLGGYSTGVTDMNNLGMVVGVSEVTGGEYGTSHAFLWQNGKIKDLGTLGGDSSIAEAINNKGQIVGASNDKNDQGYAFIWENGKMKKISAEGRDFSAAGDINDNGLIIGRLKIEDSSCKSCKERGVILKDNELIFFDEPVSFSDVNNQNEAVGIVDDIYLIDKIWSHYSSDQYSEISSRVTAGGSTGHAVLYKNGDLIRLDDLVNDSNIIFISAKSINDNGEILASGFSYADNYSHEYLISLPQNMPPTFRFTVDGDNIVAEESWKSDQSFNELLKENPVKYKITWEDADADDDAEISLYYYYNGIGHQNSYKGEGELLISGLSEDSSVDSFVWDMSGYKPGDYYLYAVIEDKAGKRIFESDRLKVIKKVYRDAVEMEKYPVLEVKN